MSARLQIDHLVLGYGGHAVLRGVDLALHPGELVGLIGPNGSGKSTLMRACAGLLVPSAGTVHIDGFDLVQQRLQAQHRFGHAVEPERLPPVLRGRQCLELVAHARGLPAAAIEEALSLSQRLGLARWIDIEVGEYSLGTRQKLAVVLALLGAPPLLLLDEVMNGLDPLAAFALKEELRARADAGAAVLLATHGLEVAERFLDRAVLLLDGRIAADWNRDALRVLREQSPGGLEAAVVAHLRRAAAR